MTANSGVEPSYGYVPSIRPAIAPNRSTAINPSGLNGVCMLGGLLWREVLGTRQISAVAFPCRTGAARAWTPDGSPARTSGGGSEPGAHDPPGSWNPVVPTVRVGDARHGTCAGDLLDTRNGRPARKLSDGMRELGEAERRLLAERLAVAAAQQLVAARGLRVAAAAHQQDQQLAL